MLSTWQLLFLLLKFVGLITCVQYVCVYFDLVQDILGIVFQEFFEQDEYFSTPINKEPQLSDSRVPLMQVSNKTTVTNDKPDQRKTTTTPLSSQKLKTFAFSRSKLKDEGKPPSKRLALESNLSVPTTPICSFSSPLNSSSGSTIPHLTNTSSFVPSSVTLASSLSHSTPTCLSITALSSSSCHGSTSLPTTPLSSRPSAKRKFPGPAGLLPKLVCNNYFMCITTVVLHFSHLIFCRMVSVVVIFVWICMHTV